MKTYLLFFLLLEGMVALLWLQNSEANRGLKQPHSEEIALEDQIILELIDEAPLELPIETEIELTPQPIALQHKDEEAPILEKPPNLFPWPKLFSIRHVWGEQEADCIPFATNYTTAELLLAPDYRLGKMFPFLDLRGHRFDNNTYAANGGLGGRYVPDPEVDPFCEVLGFNFYYDFRQGCIGYYQQVGLGLEVLGSRWDFRANAYAPFGKKRHIHSCLFDDYEGDYYAIRDSIESISYSFNAEIGAYLFKGANFSLYAAGGPYFLARAKYNDGVVGGEVRLQPQYKDYVGLGLSWRYDQLFETIWQVEMIFTLPLYQISGRNKNPCSISDRQIYQPVERFEVMPLSKKTCWFTNY